MQQPREGQTGTLPDGRRVIVRNGQPVLMNAELEGTTRLANGTLLSAPGPRGGAPRPLMNLSVQEQGQLGRARDVASSLTTDLADTERFNRLMSRERTGGYLAIPGMAAFMASQNPNIDEMQEISARLTPAQREPGSGASTDADMRLFGRAVPSATRFRQANTAMIDRGRSRAGEAQLRSEFMDSYASRNGTLQGALQQWTDIYRPPPVRPGTPEPRASVRPTEAQRAAIEAMTGRDRTAVLGTRANPRVPPRGFDTNTFPMGDYYVNSDGTLMVRGGAAAQQQQPSRVVGVRRVR